MTLCDSVASQSVGFVPRRYLLTCLVLLALVFVAATHHTLHQTSVFGASQLSPYQASSVAVRHPSCTRCEAFSPAPQFTPPDGLVQSFGAQECEALLSVPTPSTPLSRACARQQRHLKTSPTHDDDVPLSSSVPSSSHTLTYWTTRRRHAVALVVAVVARTPPPSLTTRDATTTCCGAHCHASSRTLTHQTTQRRHAVALVVAVVPRTLPLPHTRRQRPPRACDCLSPSPLLTSRRQHDGLTHDTTRCQ